MAGYIVADADVISFKAFCYGLGQVGVNVWHYKVDAAVGDPTIIDVGLAVDATAASVYKAIISEQVEYWGSIAARVGPTVGPGEEFEVNRGVGLVAGDALPTQISGVITKRTDLIGRANRGRCYIPFPGETHNDDNGLPTDAYMTLLGNLGAAMLTTFNVVSGGASCNLIPVIRHAGGTTTLVARSFPRQKWGQQHRRGSYGQANNPPF